MQHPSPAPSPALDDATTLLSLAQDQPLAALRRLMARLRDRERGCPWDVEQTFATIAPYTIEEAHEVADAVARNDVAAIRDELGDLLLQVVFQSQIASDDSLFDLDDVARGIVAKMVRRHPHVFGGDSAASPGWEAIKAAERAGAGDDSALAGVALALPALMRAQKLQSRAARVGFDWPDASGPAAKVAEELAELASAPDQAARVEEAGDLIFAVVNLMRHLNIDAEAALRAGNAKFERRFRAMETRTPASLSTLSLDEQEALWLSVKADGG